MSKMFDSTASGLTPMNDITLAQAQVVRGNDPLQQNGVHYYTKGSGGTRFLWQDGERIYWQPVGEQAHDIVARW
jgi:hypothetical protein